jgi:putative tricarboxylic transport membrane protein
MRDRLLGSWSGRSMNPSFLANKDFWGGLMLIASGAATMIIARNYAFGTTLRMGPGYFPTVLGGILILFGLSLLVTGLRSSEKIEGSWSWRAMIMLPLALILFGVLMTYAGFVPALMALIFASALAGPQFKLLEVLALTVVLTALSVALFVWGLGLPYQLIADY